jgi:hypothetical protein
MSVSLGGLWMDKYVHLFVIEPKAQTQKVVAKTRCQARGSRPTHFLGLVQHRQLIITMFIMLVIIG